VFLILNFNLEGNAIVVGNSTSKFEALRKQADKFLEKVNRGQDESPDPSLSFDELIHELEVYHVELELQNLELQETHQRLEENRREYIDLFDHAPIGYIITDDKGKIRSVNLTLTAMFASNRADIEGKPLARFINDAYVDTYYICRQNLFASEQAQTCEVLMELADDQRFFARLDCTLIPHSTTCRIALTDITQQKRTEQMMRSALERERELNQLKNGLLGMITHEFRTPLTVILSSVSLLRKRMETDAKKEKYCRNIDEYANHMVHMIAEVERAYHTNSFTVKAQPTRFDCRELLANLVEDTNTIHSDRVQFFVQSTSQPDYEIYFDDSLLRQIVMDLVDNAIKYSMDEVLVKLEMLRDAFVISVMDMGIGIPEEDQKYIFDAFFRAKNTLSVASSGTGLGLSITKRLVETCQGTIELESQVDQGTTFTLTFPCYMSKA